MRALMICAMLIGVASCQESDAAQTGQPRRFRTIGRDASYGEIRTMDIDANGSGAGLPSGRGTYAKGVDVYAKQCASCHGAKGEGIAPYPKLIGPEPKNFPFGDDPKAVKTIGNYWPYATTLYDYINRAMPFNASSTLKPDEVYSVVAFLLAENGIIGKDAVMNSRTLPAVKMPSRDRFVMDDRKGGPGFK
jgi:hypothetical protein